MRTRMQLTRRRFLGDASGLVLLGTTGLLAACQSAAAPSPATGQAAGPTTAPASAAATSVVPAPKPQLPASPSPSPAIATAPSPSAERPRSAPVAAGKPMY